MDTPEQMLAHLNELRVAHENDAIDATLGEFIGVGEKLESQFTWLMAGTGAAIALLLTQWSVVSSAIGHGTAIATVILLAIALLCGLVAKLEIYQAQFTTSVWGKLPAKVSEIRGTYAAEIGNYFEYQRAAGALQLPNPPDLDQKRIRDKVVHLMPPDFNTGWRWPVWWLMSKVALVLTGHGPSKDEYGEWFTITLAAYRIGSAYWLLILYQVVLIIAGIVSAIGFATHCHCG
jgi:hypothetical protein